MSTLITYPSSLEYWLLEKGIPYRNEALYAKAPEIITRKEIINTAGSLRFSAPVHVAVPPNVKRNETEGIIFHSIPVNIPSDSFVSITEKVDVISPEMSFLLAATELSLPELVLLACELCAIYVKDPQETFLQRKREQITSVASIKDYLSRVKSTNGLTLARRAIQYALDNSNSPMESRLATLAALPLYHGGQGLGKFLLNYSIKLSGKGREILGSDYCMCDMVWLCEKVVVEYDSNLTHLTPAQHARDKKRITALQLSGFKVISITAEQVRSFNALETTFSVLRHALGMRALTDRRNKYFEKRWDVTHKIMFNKKDDIHNNWSYVPI